MSSVTIAVFMDQLNEHGVALMTGLRRYRDRHGLPWLVQNHAVDRPEAWPDTAWCLLTHRIQSRYFTGGRWQQPLCSVHTGSSQDVHGICLPDPQGCGRLAAQHGRSRGYHTAATIDVRGHQELLDRQTAFAKAWRDTGGVIHHFHRSLHIGPRRSDEQVIEWLRGLGPGLLVYCPVDGQAAWVRGLCRSAGLHVPDDVAILGTGNDLSVCVGREPELSSLDFPWYLIGVQAGLHFHHLIQGQPPAAPSTVGHYRVIERQTTPRITALDPLIQRGVDWLADHLDHPQPLQGMAAALGCSQATCCRRFRTGIGETPKQRHNRLRVELAAEQLVRTSQPIGEIARRCGFTNATALGVAFKRFHGCSPTEWRIAEVDAPKAANRQ